MSDQNKINIDNISIRLAAGWQGDPVFLARKISEQIQQQALDLQSSNQLNITLRGHFAGNSKRVSSQLSERLTKHSSRSTARRFR